MRRILLLLASVTVLLGLCGCAPPDVSGSWSGTWRTTLFSGGMSMNLSQQGTDVSGTTSIGGTLCIPQGNVTATVTSKDRFEGSFSNGIGTVDLSADINPGATRITGTFNVSAGACTGTSGTFTVDRQGG